MRTNYLLSLLALTSLRVVNLYGVNPSPDEPCGSTPKPMRVVTRHIEGNGIGYNRGYTTIEGFFAPYQTGQWTPFLDIRGHVLNDSQLAANAGFGVRYLTDSRVWGINMYYDYRNSNHQHYNQVALGLESLGKIWDFRINGYLPVGAKTSSSYDWEFDKYVGYNILLKGKREFAMKGLSYEAGFHIDHFQKFPLYFAAGPYYLEGKGKNVWGGQLRGALDLAENIRLEGNSSYDNVFKWIGQGQVSLIIPFGHKKKVHQKKNRSCSTAIALEKRVLQKVDRFEIIPVSREERTGFAIDPTTGQPIVVIHVAPYGNSNGTAASPFHYLRSALDIAKSGDIVIVQPGTYDAANENLLNGFTPGNGILLSSSSVSQSVSTQYGRMNLPQSTGAVVLTNSRDNTQNDTRILNMADNLSLSGFRFQGSDVATAISSADPVANASISQNTFAIASQNGDCSAIELELTGVSNIKRNLILALGSKQGDATGLNFLISGANTTVKVSNNRLLNIYAPRGNAIGYALNSTGDENRLISSHNIYRNIQSSDDQYLVYGCQVQISGSDTSTDIIGDSYSNLNSLSQTWGIYISSSATNGTTNIQGCSIYNSDGPNEMTGIFFEDSEEGSQGSLSLSQNILSDLTTTTKANGIQIITESISTTVDSNTIELITSNSVYPGDLVVGINIESPFIKITNNVVDKLTALKTANGLFLNSSVDSSQMVITSNNINDLSGQRGYATAIYVSNRGSTSSLCATLEGNIGSEPILAENLSSGPFNVYDLNNNPSITTSGTVTFISDPCQINN